MILACGSDDKVNFTKEHFGDSKYFLIFNLSQDKIKLLKVIKNDSPEEKAHGDPEKARYISTILNKENVDSIFAYAMGPNIVRMKEKFIPIISRIENVRDALKKLQQNLDKIEKGKIIYIE